MTFAQWLISRLRTHGAYMGKMDDAEGRAVIEALQRFQQAKGLPVTGKADQATVDALRADPKTDSNVVTILPQKVPAEPIWMREARRFMGLKEVAGPSSNPTILGWAKRLGGWTASFYTNDDIPWCGLFVSNVLATTLPQEFLPTNPLGALNWRTFGREVSPALGAILVFSREGGGHVGFYVGEDETHFHVLAGNQSNMVSITRIPKERLVAGGVRWPKTGEAPVGGRVLLSPSGAPVSKSEV